jgi:hypothetical protein
MHPNDGRVVSNFIVQALKGAPITLYGTGSQSRSFCYVDDLVTGMIAMTDQDELVGPVNLGNPGECPKSCGKPPRGCRNDATFLPDPFVSENAGAGGVNPIFFRVSYIRFRELSIPCRVPRTTGPGSS